MHKLFKKRIGAFVIALMVALSMSFTSVANATTVAFPDAPATSGGTGGGKGELAPRGFAIDINGTEEGGLYWLQSEYDNKYWLPVWTGETNGYAKEIPAIDENGEKIVYNFNAYVDKNPGTISNQEIGPFIVLYKNGEKVDLKGNITVGETEMLKVGAPIRGSADRNGNLADPSGQSGRWTVPITLTLEPNCDYEFAFLRGARANNGITGVISEIGDGYLQNPSNTLTDEEKEKGMTMSELDWYNAHMYDEYMHREYKYQTYKEEQGVISIDKTTENPNVGKLHPMRFSFSTAPIMVDVITLNKTNASILMGQTLELVATVSPEDATDKTLAWSSSNAKVATVKDGKVTAVGIGTATIKVTSNDGKASAECKVTVKPVKVSNVKVNATKATVTVGNTKSLKATVYPSNATNKAVTWKSSNSKIAKVSSKGKVTAVNPGKAIITATTKDGSFKTKTVVSVIPKNATFKLYPKKNTITVKLNKVKGVSGYEIYRAHSKNGKFNKLITKTQKSSTTYTSRWLPSGKTYYYKVRTYKTVDGKKIYSKFSTVKKAKTK